MIIKKKLAIILNKKNEISNIRLNIPTKAIKILGINEEENSINIQLIENKMVITKGGSHKFYLRKINNGKNTVFEMVILKEFAVPLGINNKNDEVVIDYTKERIIIKKSEQEEKMERLETKIISILNFKGGVGKTTTAHSLGTGLGLEGKKVLLIDMDPQASLTFLSLKERDVETVDEVLLNKKNINKIIKNIRENVDLIPSYLSLEVATYNFPRFGAEKLLLNNIKELETHYDYIIIDCPPSFNELTVNALYASQDVIVPCETEVCALDGLNLLLQTLKQKEKELNIKIENTYVLPTKLDKRLKISTGAYDHLINNYKTIGSIRICSKLKELGLGEKLSIYEIDENSTAAIDYREVIKELEK